MFPENGFPSYLCTQGYIDGVHLMSVTEGTVFMKPAVAVHVLMSLLPFANAIDSCISLVPSPFPLAAFKGRHVNSDIFGVNLSPSSKIQFLICIFSKLKNTGKL